MVVGSNLGEPKLNLYFSYFWFWIEYERVEENPSSQGGLENHHKTTN